MVMLTIIILAVIFALSRYGLDPAPNARKAGAGNSGREAIIQNVLAYKSAIADSANRYGVDPSVIAGIIAVESGGKPSVIGSFEEVGLMQVREIALQDLQDQGIISRFTNEVPSNPSDNIEIGTAFYMLQENRVGGNEFEALRAYNAGYRRANNNALISRDYANEVLEFAENFEDSF
jgi:soluble lytic murein transglycosylase-like protein